jgi:hypothetical protein
MTTYNNSINNQLFAALNMNSNLINNVTDPQSGQDAATKAYVDRVAAGLNPAQSVDAATTPAAGNIAGTYLNGVGGIGATFQFTATGTAVIDTVSTTVGKRYLIKDQTAGLQNGVYVLTTQGTGLTGALFTRALDYDQPSDINNTGIIPVINGATNASTGWLQTATITTVGTDALTFIKFISGTSGTVTSIATNNGVTGGTITSTGTIGLAASFTINGGAPSGSFVMDASGRITEPNKPSFLAYLAANTAAVTGDGTQYDIISYTSTYDVNSNFNAATGVFTAPVTGTYTFWATIALTSLGAGNTAGKAWFNSGSLPAASSYISWQNWASIRDSASNTAFLVGSVTVKMNATGTIKLSLTESANGAKNVVVAGTAAGSYTQFGGCLVG